MQKVVDCQYRGVLAEKEAIILLVQLRLKTNQYSSIHDGCTCTEENVLTDSNRVAYLRTPNYDGMSGGQVMTRFSVAN